MTDSHTKSDSFDEDFGNEIAELIEEEDLQPAVPLILYYMGEDVTKETVLDYEFQGQIDIDQIETNSYYLDDLF